MDRKPSTLTTSVVASIGAIPAGLLVNWLKTKGIELDAAQQAALVTTGGIAVGAASGWVVAIIDSFVKAVVAANDAIASAPSSIAHILGRLRAPAPGALARAPGKHRGFDAGKHRGFARVGMLLALCTALLGMTLLAGCPSVPKLPDSKTLPPAANVALKAIVSANAALATAYDFIGSGVRSGAIEPKQGRAWFDTLEGYKAKVDEAQRLFDSGGFDAAKAQAAGTEALIKFLHDQAIKSLQDQARKSAIFYPEKEQREDCPCIWSFPTKWRL